MTVLSTKVELGFGENAPGNWFVLDDATRGLLDGATYVLSGAYYYDVTQYVTNVAITRGKSRELDRFNAGAVNVTFDNTNRYFDPTNTASPFYGQIVPRRDVRISAAGITQFYGLVDDWNLDYNISGASNASLTAFDGFSLLSGQTLTAGTAASQLSGARINAVLNDAGVNWSASARSIDAGGQTLQADVIAANTNAVSYINIIEKSEPGRFFIDKKGYAIWKDRSATYASSNAVVLSDDGTGIPYSDVQVVYGSELLYNQVKYTRLNGGTATADDLTSQATYGIRTLSDDGLLMSTDTALGQLAVYTVSQYAQPEYRFESIKISMLKLTPAQQTSILNLEIGSVCRVKFTPNNVGTQIDKWVEVIGISHSVSAYNYQISLSFQTLDYTYLVLDDPAVGLLDYNLLSF